MVNNHDYRVQVVESECVFMCVFFYFRHLFIHKNTNDYKQYPKNIGIIISSEIHVDHVSFIPKILET